MSVDAPLTISIDRSGMDGAPAPLVFSATLDGTALGIFEFQRPGLQMAVTYAPDSASRHGSVKRAAKYQQAILGWDWAADLAADETTVQAAYAEVAAAIAQFAYTVTTQVSDAPAEVWSADPGTLVPSSRSYLDLANPDQAMFSVSIPVYPIPGSV